MLDMYYGEACSTLLLSDNLVHVYTVTLLMVKDPLHGFCYELDVQ